MKITYTENPLRTVIELDEVEKKELWYKLKIEEMRYLLHGAKFYLDENNVERARKEVDSDYYYSPKEKGEGDDTKSDLDKRVDMLHEEYINDLLDMHCGDCTCIASSCGKCHAENTLGIDTIKGLRKHEASKIGSAFDKWNRDTCIWEKNVRTLNEVVDYLAHRSEHFDEEMAKDPPDWKGWESCMPRWKQECANAAVWIKNYRDTHFPLKEPVDPNAATRENTSV